MRMNKLKISDYFSSVPRFKHKCLEFWVIVFSTHTSEYMDIYCTCIEIAFRSAVQGSIEPQDQLSNHK